MFRKIVFIILGGCAIVLFFISIINKNYFNMMLLPSGLLFLVLGFKTGKRKKQNRFKQQISRLKLYMQGRSDAYIEHRLSKRLNLNDP